MASCAAWNRLGIGPVVATTAGPRIADRSYALAASATGPGGATLDVEPVGEHAVSRPQSPACRLPVGKNVLASAPSPPALERYQAASRPPAPRRDMRLFLSAGECAAGPCVRDCDTCFVLREHATHQPARRADSRAGHATSRNVVLHALGHAPSPNALPQSPLRSVWRRRKASCPGMLGDRLGSDAPSSMGNSEKPQRNVRHDISDYV